MCRIPLVPKIERENVMQRSVQRFPCWAYGKHGMGTYRPLCYIR